MNPCRCLNAVSLSPTTLNDAQGDFDASVSTLHRTGGSSLDVWEFGPGEFEWCAEWDQSACVLSGNAELTLADGRLVELRPGISFYLPRGVHGHWLVSQRLRTVAVRST